MHDQATHWLLRQRAGDMDAADWEEFTLWLEANARHAVVFDRLAEADEPLDHMDPDAGLDPVPEEVEPEAVNDNPIARLLPWVIASAAAMVLAIFIWPQSAFNTTRIATAPGEIETLALSDAITMTLNGASAVEVSETAPDVRLEAGEVAFAIVSDEPSPLRVEVDGLVLTDIGTEFNVVLDETRVQVAVADGVVAVNFDSADVEIGAGEAVEKARGDDALVRSKIDPDSVASWREGRLDFNDTPIDRALVQLERSAGVTLIVAPRLANVRLSGSVRIDAEDEVVAHRMAGLIQGTARPDGERWIIE